LLTEFCISAIRAVESSCAFLSAFIHIEERMMDAETIIKKALMNIIP
jgi:hypothetical protein